VFDKAVASARFHVDAVQDAPGDLALTIRDRPGESFRLWLPENIWRDLPGLPDLPRPTPSPLAHRAYAVLRLDLEAWQTTPWERTDAGGMTRAVSFPSGKVRATATPVRDELELELDVTNGSARTWTDCWAEVCLRLATSPAFADTARQRTLGRIDGQWATLETTPLCEPHPDWNTYLGTPPVEFVKRCMRDWWCRDFPVQLDHPIIAVHDRDDSAVVGIGFETPAEYCNNLEPDFACIHSDPLLGEIRPGGTAKTRGKIVYAEGSKTAFVARASEIRVA
jgi:hypothetical protein